MKHITILVPERAILGSLEGTRQLFTQVNQFLMERGDTPAFQVQLAGLSGRTQLTAGLYTVNTELAYHDVQKTDLIIIPAVDGDKQQAIEQNRALLPWIQEQYRAGAEVASLCVGAFLLAATGLLDGRRCATHWMAATEFREMFPRVDLVTERIITEEQGLYSSGGAFSYLNLILYLIAKYAGRDMAVMTAKVFAIEMERENQLSFMIFQGHKNHLDEPIRQAQEYIEQNYQERITVEQLASMYALSRRNFERRFKKATNSTVMEYIQRVKVEAAKKSFESSRKNINEVMYDVGYNDLKAFRTVFRRVTGLSPLAYRNKYNKDAA